MPKNESGAAKRKKKREKELKIQKLPKITSFFSDKEKGNQTSVSEEVPERSTAFDDDPDDPEPLAVPDEPDLKELQEGHEDEDPSKGFDQAHLADSSLDEEDDKAAMDGDGSACLSSFPSTLLEEQYPTDKGHFPSPTQLSLEDIKFIVRLGFCRPNLDFPKDTCGTNKGRGFSSFMYNMKTDSGLILPRFWLCYSPKLNVCYCQPCWLFSDCSQADLWKEGFNDWSHLSRAVQRHEQSLNHQRACQIYRQHELLKTVDEVNQEYLQEVENYWRKVIHRIMNVTLTLACNNLSFRGHREDYHSGDTSNKGNFLAVIDLISKYDPVLEELLQKPKGTTTYLGPQIQNEIIDLLGDAVVSNIRKEIQSSPFFSIIVDSTQDIAKVDQLSIIFRYCVVISVDGVPKEIEIRESFLGFHICENQKSADLAEQVLQAMEKHQLSLNKLRGQGYDGASNMSGQYNGLQALLQQKQPLAHYVHCANHNLNLVLNDSVSCVREVADFYDLVQSVYVFFAHSISRWAVLESNKESIVYRTLKKLCPTRWSSRNDALVAMRFRYSDVLKVLTQINLCSTKEKERQEAAALKGKLETFETVILLIIETKIVSAINVVSKMLEAEQQDLHKAVSHLEKIYNEVSNLRNDFESVKIEAAEVARSWGVAPVFRSRRLRRVRRHFDELATDERIQDAEENFKVNVFYRTIDIIVSQLHDRFRGHKKIANMFQSLMPSFISSGSDKELYDATMLLVSSYPDDIAIEYCAEMQSFKEAFQTDISRFCTIRELAVFLIIDNYILSSSFPNIVTACMLFLTLPVTVCSAERSFSKLRLIKSYLRGTMTQGRLASLAVLSIERETAKSLEIDALISDFATRKARKGQF